MARGKSTKSKKKPKKSAKVRVSSRIDRRVALVFIALFAIVAGALLWAARADTYTMSVGPAAPITVPSGYTARVFASNVTDLRPRDLQFTPGGTLLVSAMRCVDIYGNGKCGDVFQDSPIYGKVYALPDANKDGVADQKKVVIDDGFRAHGLGFYNNMPTKLFVAEDTELVTYNWNEAALTATGRTVLMSMPTGGGDAHHPRKSFAINQSTGKLYIGLGANCHDGTQNYCNVGGSASNTATVWEYDINSHAHRVFATGMRNASFATINPFSGELWTSEMSLENWGLPTSLPPDEINIVRDGKNYGFPQCFGNRQNYTAFSYNCATTEPPAFSLPAHASPLGMEFINNNPQFSQWQGKLLVALHGGYDARAGNGDYVAMLDVSGNTVSNLQRFINFDDGSGPPNYNYRPVDIAFDSAGSLYITDDVHNSVYIVQKQITTPAPPPPPPANSPDLIVTDVSWTPASPTPGQAVTFKATIKNQGTGASPAGTIHGVAFSVDGDKLTWSDNFTSSLAAGASTTVTANGGVSAATWPAASGTHSVEAWVDDAARIAENNENNNKLSESIIISSTTTPPPTPTTADLIVTSIDWTPATPAPGQAVTFKATIKNQGTAATPGNVIHGVAFSVDGSKLTWSDTFLGPLASGASTTLTANNGIAGSTWTAVTGAHSIEAYVDDINRIPGETYETNNTSTISLTPVVVPPVTNPADTTKPSKPGTPQKTLASQTSISISWGASTDNVKVVGYQVYRNGTKVASPTGTTFTDSNLTASTTYSYQVSAYDAGGNESDQSAALSVSTTAATTTPPPTTTTPPPSTDQPITITPGGTTVPVTIPANDQPVVSGSIKISNPTTAKTSTTTLKLNGNAKKTVDGDTGVDIDTTTLQNGTHAVTLETTDADGNVTTTSRYLTVDNKINPIEKVRNFIFKPFAGTWSGRTMNLVFGLSTTMIAVGLIYTVVLLRPRGMGGGVRFG